MTVQAAPEADRGREGQKTAAGRRLPGYSGISANVQIEPPAGTKPRA